MEVGNVLELEVVAQVEVLHGDKHTIGEDGLVDCTAGGRGNKHPPGDSREHRQHAHAQPSTRTKEEKGEHVARADQSACRLFRCVVRVCVLAQVRPPLTLPCACSAAQHTPSSMSSFTTEQRGSLHSLSFRKYISMRLDGFCFQRRTDSRRCTQRMPRARLSRPSTMCPCLPTRRSEPVLGVSFYATQCFCTENRLQHDCGGPPLDQRQARGVMICDTSC